MITQLNPYLFFDGTAHEAIRFYEKALDARVEGLMRYRDMPGSNAPPEQADQVVHCLLHLGPATLMVSDTDQGRQRGTGGNVDVSIRFDDVAEVDRRFELLSQGGKVSQAPHDAFWGDRFAAVTDRFGVRWMLTATPKKPG